MVWSYEFFFAFRKHIYRKYQNFYEVEEQDIELPVDGDEDSTKISTTEAVARFYFGSLNLLAKDDVTKYQKVLRVPLYLCLNAMSAHKERVEKDNERLRKEELEWKSMSRSRR